MYANLRKGVTVQAVKAHNGSEAKFHAFLTYTLVDWTGHMGCPGFHSHSMLASFGPSETQVASSFLKFVSLQIFWAIANHPIS